MLPEQAAATLAALSVAEPSSACRLLTQQLEGLEEASSQLASLVRHPSTSLHSPCIILNPLLSGESCHAVTPLSFGQESEKRVASSIKIGLTSLHNSLPTQ